ncbi:hypothetical protein [Mariniphaga sp.]|uniref:hypothetical protein n=1 Tax=Mariniphaga sp. TaxID=1954475 RepID=UPI00356A46BF
MTWKPSELRDKVNNRYGEKQVQLFEPAMSSFSWKLLIANYHADEHGKIIKRLLRRQTGSKNERLLKIALNFGSNELVQKNNIDLFTAEANLIAFAQTLHSMADILAHIIYYSLSEDSFIPVDEDRISLRYILEKLKDLPEFSPLKAEIENLINLSSFQYLNAYVNTVKHRRLISSNLFTSLIDKKSFGFKIMAFEYRNMSYNEKNSKDFIEKDRKSIQDAFNKIGNEISNCL